MSFNRSIVVLVIALVSMSPSLIASPQTESGITGTNDLTNNGQSNQYPNLNTKYNYDNTSTNASGDTTNYQNQENVNAGQTYPGDTNGNTDWRNGNQYPTSTNLRRNVLNVEEESGASKNQGSHTKRSFDHDVDLSRRGLGQKHEIKNSDKAERETSKGGEPNHGSKYQSREPQHHRRNKMLNTLPGNYDINLTAHEIPGSDEGPQVLRRQLGTNNGNNNNNNNQPINNSSEPGFNITGLNGNNSFGGNTGGNSRGITTGPIRRSPLTSLLDGTLTKKHRRASFPLLARQVNNSALNRTIAGNSSTPGINGTSNLNNTVGNNSSTPGININSNPTTKFRRSSFPILARQIDDSTRNRTTGDNSSSPSVNISTKSYEPQTRFVKRSSLNLHSRQIQNFTNSSQSIPSNQTDPRNNVTNSIQLN